MLVYKIYLLNIVGNRIRTQRIAHGPSPRMDKGPFGINPDPTRKSEEGRHRDHANLDLTCGLRFEDGKRVDPSSEEPEEQMYLGNALVGHLYQKTRHHGRHQRRVSKEERKYLEKVDITSTFNALHQLSWLHL